MVLRIDLSVDHSDHMWLFYLSRQQFPSEQCKIWGTLCDFKLEFAIPDVIRIPNENKDMDTIFVAFEVKKYRY